MAARLAGRGLGVDLGTRRIGVAVCDSDGRVASPYETVERHGDRQRDHRRLSELVAESEAVFVVVGVPYTLSHGDTGPAAGAILQEIDELRSALPESCQLHLQDERLTTVTADRRLTEMNIRGRRRRQLVDQIAAAIILQTWLDRHPSP
jgi:putative Holliday junction resolvase